MKKWLILSGVAVIAIFAGIMIGSQNVSLPDVLWVFGQRIFGTPSEVAPNSVSIIWDLRIPRVLLAFLVGAAVSASGAVMQSTFQNPLASPYTMGIASGASLGAGLAIVLKISFFGLLTLPLFGLSFALATMFILLVFCAKLDTKMTGNTIILAGMVFSLFLNAILMLISALNFEDMRAITLWQMGSFALRGWQSVALFVPFFIVGTGGIVLMHRRMDILSLGDDQAITLGVNAKRTKILLYLLVALLTGSAVALAGIIGFIDLISPHIARKIFGAKHSRLIPSSMLLGGAIMVICDLVSRVALPGGELPIGAISAFIGAPFFAVVFFRRRKIR